jgi:2Fe-2S iron-sulfur cluster binding domain
MPEKVSVDVAPGSSLALAAEAAGVDILYMCGIGDCGSCEIELIDIGTGVKRVVRTCIAAVPSDTATCLFHSYPEAIW